MKNFFKLGFASLLLIFITNLYSADKFTETEKEMESWKHVISGKQKEIAHFKELTSIICTNMEQLLKDLEKARDNTDLKLDQLRFDLVVGSTSPYDYRQVLREICHTALEFQHVLLVDNQKVDALTSYLDMINEAKLSLDELKKAKNLPPDIIRTLDDMDRDLGDIQIKFTYYRDALKSSLSKTNTYSGISFNNPTKFNEVVFNQLRSFYLTPDLDLFSKSAWMMSRYLGDDWINSFKLKMIENFPNNYDEVTVFTVCLISGIILFFIFSFIINKVVRLSEKHLKPFKKSLFWFILAIVLVTYNYNVEFMPKNSLVVLLAILFFVRSLLLLGWGLRVKDRENVDINSTPFAPLFWLYAYGVILQFLDQYFVFLSTTWLIGLVVFVFLAKKQFKKNFFSFEKTFLGISIAASIICILLTLAGLAYLSILSMMGWFLVCLGIQMARYIKYTFSDLVKYIEGNYLMLKIILIGISIPVLWLFIILMIFMWGVGQVFGSYFFVSFINMNFQLYNYNLNLSNLIFIVYLFFVFQTITNVAKVTIKKLSEKSTIESGAAPSITLLVNYGAWALYIGIMLKLLGMDMTSLTVISGGLSVGIGFGMRDVLNNFVSGLIILFSHSIKHGDIIQVGEVSGKVIKITIRSTVVKTADNAIVAIPNSTIISSNLINWTKQDLIVRKDITVGVAYGSDFDKVKSILTKIASEAKYVLTDPAPAVSLDNFAESSITLTLKIWISDIAYAASVLSNIREKIYADFNKNSIEMPFPQMDIHLKTSPVQETESGNPSVGITG